MTCWVEQGTGNREKGTRNRCGLFESLVDSGFDEGGHDGVAGGEGMDAVAAEIWWKAVAGVLHGGVVVDVDVAVVGGPGFDPAVDLDDLGGGGEAGLPGIIEGGKDGAEDDADVIGGGEVGHGGEILLGLLDGHGAGVSGDVVGAGEDDDDFGLEVDDVLAEAEDHLWSGLAADAAIDVWLAFEGAAGAAEVPAFGDGVTHEDDAVFAGGGWAELQIVLLESGERGKVAEHLLVVLGLIGVVRWGGGGLCGCGGRLGGRGGFGLGEVSGFLGERGKRGEEGGCEEECARGDSSHESFSMVRRATQRL